MGEEKREPGTYCSHVLSSLGNMHTTGRTEHAFFSAHARELGNEANDHSEQSLKVPSSGFTNCSLVPRPPPPICVHTNTQEQKPSKGEGLGAFIT